MAGSQNVSLKPDLEGKHIDPVGFLSSRETPEDKKKVRSVDFYELDVVKNNSEEPDPTSNVRSEVTEEEGRKNLEDKKDVNNQPQENRESSNYLDQDQPSSAKLSRKKSNLTCPCKECVENYLNVRESTEEPIVNEEKKDEPVNVRESTEEPLVDEEKKDEAVDVRESTEEPLVDEEKKDEAVNMRESNEEPLVDEEKKDEAVNLRESTEEPLVDEEKKDEATPGDDSTSVRSRSISETSRHTDSSEDDFKGTRCEDAQVTLPYPDKNSPPECIARLSNAGLYDQSEEPTGKTGDEDKISQVVVNTAFFVKHPALEEQKNVRMDEYDKVDIEKGDPESEPLMRLTRRPLEKEPIYPGFCQCHKACLKLVGSFVLSMLIFPAFLFGAYAWLPFDAPLIPDVPTRLVYTLRCSAFASFPIVLGVIIHGISRLCASSYDPFKPREREVTVHRRFVKQSTFLFVLFFFNLSVLATYLPQKHLKFIPLLTCLFSLSQLIYWLSFAVGRSFRGFGYGLTFLPLLSMLICNLYFMFVIEPEKMVFLGNRVVPQH